VAGQSPPQEPWTMRPFLLALFLCIGLQACDQTNSAVPRFVAEEGNRGFKFDDQFAGATSTDGSLLRVHSRIASTSSNGEEADVVLTYSIDPYIRPALRPGSYVQFSYVTEDNQTRPLARSNITDDLAGSVEVTIPTTVHNANIAAGIDGLVPGVIDDTGILISVTPAIPVHKSTDLNNIGAVNMQLVDGSYETELKNGRRLHRFAVRVTDPTAKPVFPNGDGPSDYQYSISGLEAEASSLFSIAENGVVDIESPVTVNFERHKQEVYLVIDRSKSIVESRLAHRVIDAVSRAVITLAKNAEFDYRLFSQQVERVESLRQFEFDTDTESGTALYYAIDRTLADIEQFGSFNQDKIVIVFTDGMDLSSRNHYNDAFIDNDQVFEFVKQRVSQVVTDQLNNYDRQLKVYTMGFYEESEGVDIPLEIARLDEIASNGGTKHSYNNQNTQSIQQAFDAVVQNIQGVYYLQYSSQQTATNNKLQLSLTIDGHEPAIIDLPVVY